MITAVRRSIYTKSCGSSQDSKFLLDNTRIMVDKFSIACVDFATEYSRRYEPLLPFSLYISLYVPIVFRFAVLPVYYGEKNNTDLSQFCSLNMHVEIFFSISNCDAKSNTMLKRKLYDTVKSYAFIFV